MWPELEERVKTLSGEELRKELLANFEYILENFGEPCDYYNDKSSPGVNECIGKLMDIGFIIFEKDNENLVKELYQACKKSSNAPQELADDKEKYEGFYVDMYNTLVGLWYYGDKRETGGYGAYTLLRTGVKMGIMALEQGNISDIEILADKYTKNTEKTRKKFGPQYS